MSGSTEQGHRFECVEPGLGEQLWRLDTDDIAPELRDRLERHLRVCDDCRLQRDLHARLSTLAAAGELDITVSERPARRWRPDTLMAAGGGLALAASLALMMLLPPSMPRAPGVSRGEEPGTGFTRPVEGEVLADATPALAWRPVDGATGYSLEITQTDGDYAWRARTGDTRVELPAEAALPDGGRFLVLLEPVPVDLAPLGGISVSFRRAGPAAVFAYRIGAAPKAVRLLGALGLGLLALGAPLLRRRLVAAI